MLAGSVTGMAIALARVRRRQQWRGRHGLSGNGGSGTSAGASPGNSSPPASPGAPAQKISCFTISVLPDTQVSSQVCIGKDGRALSKTVFGNRSEIRQSIQNQTQWIAQNAKLLKMPFTIHLGDIVDQSWYYTSEKSTPWAPRLISLAMARSAMARSRRNGSLQARQCRYEAAQCPYSICAGIMT